MTDKRSINNLVLVLALAALTWRIFTWMSFASIGYVGITEDDRGVITHVSAASPAEAAGLRVGDKILALKGMERDDRPKPNQQLEYTIGREGVQRTISLQSARYITTPILGVMGTLILIIGLWTFRQFENILSFVFFLYCFIMCIHWGGYPQTAAEDVQSVLIRLYTFLSIFLGSLILHFALIYPNGQKLSSRMHYVIYSPGVIGAVLFVMTFFNESAMAIFQVAEPLLVTLFALTGGVLLFRTYFKTRQNYRSAIGINVVCLGILLGNLPYLLSEFLPFMDFGGQIEHLIYRLFFIFEPIAFAIGIGRVSRLRDDPLA